MTSSQSASQPLPIVSVVIPTLNRPQLVLNAVKSVLQQSFQSLEVIVIIDGPDPETQTSLASLADPRLRIVQNSTNHGSVASRVKGAELAQGEWIAYLDDDDSWMPSKLERQLEVAHQSPYRWPVVSCLSEVCYDDHREIWPRRLPRADEPISEYLFVRNGLFQGEGLMQTSTLLVPRELHDSIPLAERGANHDDWDWILRIAEHPDTGFESVPLPLATWNLQTTHKHLSSAERNRWVGSRDWIRSHRDRVTPLAYSSFLLAEVAARAASAGDYLAFFPLLWEAAFKGRLTLKMSMLYLAMWLLPTQQRQRIRMVIKGIKGFLGSANVAPASSAQANPQPLKQS
jgi:glycosyltransferase involved in cell wall biosynthesis